MKTQIFVESEIFWLFSKIKLILLRKGSLEIFHGGYQKILYFDKQFNHFCNVKFLYVGVSMFLRLLENLIKTIIQNVYLKKLNFFHQGINREIFNRWGFSTTEI